METHSLEEFEQQAAEFAATLLPRESGAVVVTLSGDLGAGKTTFTRAMLRSFGVEERVTSPTFVIEKIYEPAAGPFRRLVHIDAYRLKDAQDFDVLGWKELIADRGNLIIIEWPEQVGGAIPSNAIRITLRYSGEHEREIIHEKSSEH